MELNLVINGSRATKAQWDSLFSVGEHPKLRQSGIPAWYYKWNLCTDCHSPLMLCKDNPYGFKGAIYRERQEMLAAAREQARLDSEVSQDSDSSTKEFSETDTPRHKGKQRHTRMQLDAEEEPTVLQMYDNREMGVVALAEKFNVQPKWMSAFLKENGREVKKGQGGGIHKAIAKRREQKEERARTRVDAPVKHKRIKKEVPALTDALLKTLIQRYENGEKIADFVNETSIPQVMISTAFKAAGVAIRRGNPKHWAAKYGITVAA